MNEKLEKRIHQAISQVSFGESFLMLSKICEAAARYWKGIDPYDFCIQYVSPEHITFGSTNRLIWTPFNGFRADRSYCSSRFLERYDKLGPLPGREDK